MVKISLKVNYLFLEIGFHGFIEYVEPLVFEITLLVDLAIANSGTDLLCNLDVVDPFTLHSVISLIQL